MKTINPLVIAFLFMGASLAFADASDYVEMMRKGQIDVARESLLARPSGYIEALINGLHDNDEHLRVECLRTIALLNEDAFSPELQKLSADSSIQVRSLASSILAGSLNANNLDRIEPFLKDPDSVIRASAVVYYLKQRNDDVAFQRFYSDADPIIKLTAILQRANKKSINPEYRPIAIAHIQDKDRQTRRLAIQILGFVGVDDDIVVLKTIYNTKTEHPAVRGDAWTAYKKLENGALQGSRQLSDLEKALNNSDPGTRQWAAAQLMGRDDGLDILRKAAADKNNLGADEAHAALVHIKK